MRTARDAARGRHPVRILSILSPFILSKLLPSPHADRAPVVGQFEGSRRDGNGNDNGNGKGNCTWTGCTGW